MDRLGHIYGLCDPDTNQIRYVGKTYVPLEKRLKEHIWESCRGDGSPSKITWVLNLLIENKQPYIVEIEQTSNDQKLSELEKHYISIFPDLVNTNPGGFGFNPNTSKELWNRTNYRMRFNDGQINSEKDWWAKIIRSDGVTFDSVSEAARVMQVYRQSIQRVLDGTRPALNGFGFAYLNNRAGRKTGTKKPNILKTQDGQIFKTIKDAAASSELSVATIQSILSGKCPKKHEGKYVYLLDKKE